MKYVKWFKDLSREDISAAGGKGANLGELTRAGIPVPPGFVVLSSAYFKFLTANHLTARIKSLLDPIDPSDSGALNSASAKIQKLILSSPVPDQIARETITSYHRLRAPAVAVRSSATAEDLPEASFAGQQESFLNVSGDANVILKLRTCWASLFGARSIFYRHQKGFDHFRVGIAVPIQALVDAAVSGVMFTIDPISQNKDHLVIEAVYGLGDYIVQGIVTPDNYLVSKSTMHIISKSVARQEIMEIRSPKGVKPAPVPKSRQGQQKLPDNLIIKLAHLGHQIQKHYFFPQDIEWALDKKNHLYIVQSRPITTLGKDANLDQLDQLDQLEILLTGAPASPGLASGPVRIVPSAKHISQVNPGDVLVTDMTTPDFVPAMKKAAAIITNRGGLTSHAAIVSREMGIPCVVGTTTATATLTSGLIVTVNGSTGQVFQGSIHLPSPRSVFYPPAPAVPTATHLYVNLAEPEMAQKIAALPVDGVGLLRAEFMIAGIGIHPKKMLADGQDKQFIQRLADGLTNFCQAFTPRPVIYRATDFKTNEYRSLKGGDRYEPVETNPMLGFRGAYRYIKSPEVFRLELDAIKQVRNKHGLKNLWLMIPFVSTVSEMREVKKLVAASGLYRSNSFKLFMMVEIPSNVILLDDFLDVGLDGVSIGSNDLTMLILGIDRDNEEVAPNFSETNPAVMWALEKTVKTCVRRRVLCSICGQAPSLYPELVEKLVEWGITSISVNPDAISRTRDIIYQAEQKLITRKRL